MQIEDHRIEKRQIGDIGFINTNLMDEWNVTDDAKLTKANLLASLLWNQNKDTILFPYEYRWVLLPCAYSVSLITRGYSNVIDELCMRAQLLLYSPRD